MIARKQQAQKGPDSGIDTNSGRNQFTRLAPLFNRKPLTIINDKIITSKTGGKVWSSEFWKQTKTIIEKWPEANLNEMGWFITNEGDLRTAAKSRSSTGIQLRDAEKGEISFIHTHIILNDTLHLAYPCLIGVGNIPTIIELANGAEFIGDFVTLVRHIQKNDIRSMHVAVIDSGSHVRGFAEFRATEKLIDLAKCAGSNYKVILLSLFCNMRESNKKERIEHLISNGLLSIDIKPEPGYKYNEELASFLNEKEEKRLPEIMALKKEMDKSVKIQ